LLLSVEQIKQMEVFEKRAQLPSSSNGGDGTSPGLSFWVRHNRLLCDDVSEAHWSLADGSGFELPVEGGVEKAMKHLQLMTDRL